MSAVGGVVMARDIVYLTDDYSIRCCYGTIVFNYWAPFHPDKRGIIFYSSSHVSFTANIMTIFYFLR